MSVHCSPHDILTRFGEVYVNRIQEDRVITGVPNNVLGPAKNRATLVLRQVRSGAFKGIGQVNRKHTGEPGNNRSFRNRF